MTASKISQIAALMKASELMETQNKPQGADVSFGGTSLIIIVGVVLETLKQIESQMLVRYYKGFLND